MKWVISFVRDNETVLFSEVLSQKDIDDELKKLVQENPTVSCIRITRER